MRDFAFQQNDFVRGQIEEPVDPLVDLGFGVGELPAEFVHFGPFLLDVRLPLVGRLRSAERVLLGSLFQFDDEREKAEIDRLLCPVF